MKQYHSPNGDLIVGTLEVVYGVALINGIDEEGHPDYAGETKLDWNDQRPARDATGERIWICDMGQEWRFDQLRPIQEDSIDVPAR